MTDRLITQLEHIQVKFCYPLSNDATLTFHHPGGFTLSAFWGAVYEGYEQLQEAKSPAAPTRQIWDHAPDDLFLEEFEEVAPGLFNLHVGS